MIDKLSNEDLVNLFEEAVRQNHYDPFESKELSHSLDDLRSELLKRLPQPKPPLICYGCGHFLEHCDCIPIRSDY